MSDPEPDTGGPPALIIDPTANQDPDPSEDDGTDWAAEAKRLEPEVEKWKSQARKHEDRAKQNAAAAKELADLKRNALPEAEKAAAAAAEALEAGRAEGSAEAIAKLGRRLVDAEVKAAAVGRAVDVEALLDGLDRGRFLDDDGEPKVKEIAAWVEKLAPAKANGQVDLGQGARGGAKPSDMNTLIRRGAGLG